MTETGKWLIVVNPKASVGRAGRDWPEIERILHDNNFQFDVVFTEYIRHAITLVKDKINDEGYKKVIAVGGDGTFNEVINGIMNQTRYAVSDIVIGLIPVGTGNDWARTFNFPSDYKKIVKILKQEQLFAHDIGCVTYYENDEQHLRYYINIAGMGFDETVVKKVNRMKEEGKGGKINYLWSLLTCLFSFKPIHLRIEVDDKLVVDDIVFSLSVGNCKYNGSGIMQLPEAIPNDGILDLTVIRRVPILKVILNVNRLYNGSFVYKFKEVSTFTGKKVHITSVPPKSIFLETDGETLGSSPLDVTILPHAINVIAKQNEIRKVNKSIQK